MDWILILALLFVGYTALNLVVNGREADEDFRKGNKRGKDK
jgi:hypothetical protein